MSDHAKSQSLNESQLRNADVSDCENEPIHIPGSVQSHGILLTLRSSDFTILQVSESVFDILGVHHDELLHQPLSKLMPIEPVERATKRLGDRSPRLLNPIPIEVDLGGRKVCLDGILHRSGRVLILELERHISEERGYGGFGGFYEAIREVTSRMMVTENLPEVLELACDEIRKLTGFSRVLAYKFDSEWNGEVVNESKEEHVESLLHHFFPASDIPRQARDLYTTNWLRLIPNRDYKPSKIIPAINPITDKPLDLSNSVLRSVSPIHLEYMRNMGQTASMSVSLLKGRKLWGLISCHHPSPRYLKYDVRVATEFIGQMVSAQIIAREDAAEIDQKLQLKKLYDDLLKNGGGYEAIPKSFAQNAPSLLGLTDAHGAVACVANHCVRIGSAPDEHMIPQLRDWICAQKSRVIVTNDYASLKGAPKLPADRFAGLLAIRFGANDHDLIFWWRPPRSEGRKWAGDPNEGKSRSASGSLHPRKSFETWIEEAGGRSDAWSQAEIDAADELRTSLSIMGHSPANTDEPIESLKTETASIDVESQLDAKREPTQRAGKTERFLLEGFSEFAVLFLDLDGTIQNWSAGAKRLLGFSRTQVIDHDLQMFFGEEDALRSRHERLLEAVRRHGRYEDELWMYRQDQSSFWAKILLTQVRDDSDDLMGFSVVIQDVTKEKAAEEELKATKLGAEAANRSKTAFLANISHEIRTPLGAVLGFCELMTSPLLSEAERSDLYGKVKRNGEQLTVLINDLLDISKVELGKIEIERLAVDLRTFLSDLEQTFAMKAAEKGVRLLVNLATELPVTVTTDPTRLRQILINLLTNAIKFTPSGGIVSVSCSIETLGSTERLVFRINDTGRGMTEDEMERLFKPFAQADASTTRVYGGTGLGLFLSQRLARALGGDISIEWSELGKGTTFLASIEPGDVASAVRFSKLELRKETAVNPLDSSDLKGLKVLVVDDSPDNRELLKTYLNKAGAVVSLADNGQTGVDAALTGDADVVLMDIQMPVVDGNQAMRMLVNAGFDKPVIALTAHAMKEERDYSLALGFSDYVTKPINRRALVARLQEMIQH